MERGSDMVNLQATFMQTQKKRTGREDQPYLSAVLFSCSAVFSQSGQKSAPF
jgi:hypothetical protein